MKEKNKIPILIFLIATVLISVFFIWQNSEQKAERRYNACLARCELENPSYVGKTFQIDSPPPKQQICIYVCKEKYGK